MGSLSSFCCVKGTPRQDEGDCGRLSGFVDSLWLLLPSFYYFFPLSYHLSLTKDFSSEIDLLFTFSFVIDLLRRSHRNLRLLHTHTHSAHTQRVSWLIITITKRFPVRRRRRYKREGKKKRLQRYENGTPRSWGESCCSLYRILSFIIDGWWLVETFPDD